MSKAKGKVGGNYCNNGSKAWRQRLVVHCGQNVNANSMLVINSRLKAGENTYKAKNVIHAKVGGVVEIKNRRISICEKTDNSSRIHLR